MPTTIAIIESSVIVIFLLGVFLFRSPNTARLGNALAAAALSAAVATVMFMSSLTPLALVLAVLSLSTVVGIVVAWRISMLQIPALIALQNGAGAAAAFLVSGVELGRLQQVGPSVAKWGGLLALVIGAFAFSASAVAAGKLAGKLRQTTVVLKGHTVWVSVFLLFILGMAVVVASGGPDVLTVGLLTLASAAMMTGVLVAVRVGGADMPVMISFLNAASGLAAACCGIVVGNRLLVVCGATVGASGTILTGVMCRAMNRNMLSIFTGLAHHNVTTTPVSAPVSAPEPLPLNLEPPLERGIVAVREARRVVFVPGYGMALGQAQFEVVKLASLLERRGVHVRFAVHPVAGRMPGHMNVLLAEADVSYDQLIEMDEANTLFPDTDLAIVVGACDVVNPAAGNTEGTPISGMPVLRVQEARRVIVCNLDSKPGYSGVANTLYEMPHVILLFGQAKETLAQIIEGAAAGQ